LAFGPSQWAQWGSYRLQKGVENRELTRAFIAKLNSGSGMLGVVMVDDGIASLAAGHTAGKDLLLLNNQQPADSITYFNPFSVMPQKTVLGQVEKNHLPYHYNVAGTPIFVYSNRSPDKLGIFSQMLAEKPAPQ
jgi:hypothetical protein